MPWIIFLFVLVSGIFLGGGSSKAADVGDLSESGAGALALYVPVPGETVRCIDRRQDMLTVRLQNMGAIKSEGRWKITWPWQGFIIRVGATEKVGLHVRTTLEGVSESTAKDIVIDRAYLIDVKDQPTGRVSLVSQDNLFKELYLQDGTGSKAKAFSSIKFEVRYINLQKETSVASTVKKLMEVMGENPLAKNLLPLVSGPADFFISLSKAFVDNTVTKTKDNEEVDPQVRITLTLPPTTDCQGGGDKTGAIVVVRPFSTASINRFNRLEEDEQERIKKKIMRIQPNTYCAKYLVDQEKRVLFAERQNGKCPESDAAYASYLNPYFVFTINAFPRPTQEVGGSPRSLVFVDPGMGIKPENGHFSSTPLTADQIKRILQLAESHAKSKNKSLERLGELYSRHTSGALKIQKLDQNIGGVKIYALTQQKSDLLTWAREQFGETGVTLAQQSGGLSDRIAQDLLAAAHRCKFFGVSESDCF